MLLFVYPSKAVMVVIKCPVISKGLGDCPDKSVGRGNPLWLPQFIGKKQYNMINSLKIKNFTEFEQAHFDFSDGLNVIIGDNSTGKTHLLKLFYAIASVWHEAKAEQKEIPGYISSGGSDSWWQRRLAEKLVKVFKPDKLGHLHRFGQGTETEIEATLSSASESEAYGCTLKFQFSETSKTEVKLIQKPILR
ncbi:MAG TPA: hypothetical protein EYP59_06745 [Thiotrichaceae bacterium]|nr:hypothetical protein [Thiotrichaceae bacterium]